MLKNIAANKKELTLEQEGIKTPPRVNCSSSSAKQRASIIGVRRWVSTTVWQKNGYILKNMYATHRSLRPRLSENEVNQIKSLLYFCSSQDAYWSSMTRSHPVLQEAIKTSEISKNALNALLEKYPLANERSALPTPSSKNPAFLLPENLIQSETSNQRILRWCEEAIRKKTNVIV